MIYIAVCLPFKEEDPLAKVGSEAWQNVKKLIIKVQISGQHQHHDILTKIELFSKPIPKDIFKAVFRQQYFEISKYRLWIKRGCKMKLLKLKKI